MTLVVARRTPIGIRMVSDLRVIHADDIRRGYPHGVLKAVITRPHLCVAFAGSTDPGIDGIRSVRELGDSAAVEATLQPITTRSDVEFLVADASCLRIRVVRDGEVRESGWIGDYRAFVHFQDLCGADKSKGPDEAHDPRVREDFRIAGQINKAFDAIIKDDHHPTVGEGSIPLLTKGQVFEYAPILSAQGPPQTAAPRTWTRMHFGNAADGGFMYHVLTPGNPGVGAVGLYFVQGRLGLLYAPLLLGTPESYPNVSQEEFEQRVRLERGIALQSAYGISQARRAA